MGGSLPLSRLCFVSAGCESEGICDPFLQEQRTEGLQVLQAERRTERGVVTISNKNLLDPLRAVTGEDWIPGKRYKVRGFWVADAKTMCFDLNEGVQEDFRPVTPSNDAE